MKIKPLFFIVFSLVWTTFSCKPKTNPENTIRDTTYASAFDPDYSDPAAIQLADSIAAASGGIQAWKNTKLISWSFNDWNFIWNKEEDKVRAESTTKKLMCLFNLSSEEGKVKMEGEEITDENTVKEKLKPVRLAFAESMQILVMPFKLKEPGVKLTYEGELTTEKTGIKCNILNVVAEKGSTIYFDNCQLLVDLKDNLVKECRCNHNGDSLAPILLDNYKKYGEILLSDSHAKNIKIEEELPVNFFSDFE